MLQRKKIYTQLVLTLLAGIINVIPPSSFNTQYIGITNVRFLKYSALVLNLRQKSPSAAVVMWVQCFVMLAQCIYSDMQVINSLHIIILINDQKLGKICNQQSKKSPGLSETLTDCGFHFQKFNRKVLLKERNQNLKKR